jgi:Uma2 family endonuclease
VSTNDRADDLFLKASQYIQAGARAVWLLYPRTLLAYRYLPGNLEPEVRSAEAGDKFEEPELLPGFLLRLQKSWVKSAMGLPVPIRRPSSSIENRNAIPHAGGRADTL